MTLDFRIGFGRFAHVQGWVLLRIAGALIWYFESAPPVLCCWQLQGPEITGKNCYKLVL